MSQEKLAEQAGINYKHIGQIELGNAEAGTDVLVRLARALGVPVGELFETITPRDAVPHRLSPADLEVMSTALETLSAIVDRVRARQPRPSPARAPRQPRR